jgi:hypothetical protein
MAFNELLPSKLANYLRVSKSYETHRGFLLTKNLISHQESRNCYH